MTLDPKALEKAAVAVVSNLVPDPMLDDVERIARAAITAYLAATAPPALARAEQAEAERDEWKNGVFLQVEHTKTLTGKLISERDTALAEVARLREALKSICRTIFVPERTEPGDLQKAVELTIAALASKETP